MGEMQQKRPLPDSYQVCFDGLAFERSPAGVLLAGAYPAVVAGQARRAAAPFLAAGVTTFVDLTEAGEAGLPLYFPVFAQAAAGQGLAHHRLPIRDMHTPAAAYVSRILDVVDTAVFAGETVYVHCYGGIGRTGTIIGCWLARHGLCGREALRLLARWRQDIPSGGRVSPETEAQRQRVLTWLQGA